MPPTAVKKKEVDVSVSGGRRALSPCGKPIEKKKRRRRDRRRQQVAKQRPPAGLSEHYFVQLRGKVLCQKDNSIAGSA